MDNENKVATNGITPGLEGTGAPGPINPVTGQHTSYWILSEEDRSKGFIRPVRRSYVHVGPPGPDYPLRNLTPEEMKIWDESDTTMYEEYPKDHPSKALGKFWTKEDRDKAGKGCGTRTTMGLAIAETYASRPTFYGSTFCVGCGTHLPVGPDGEFVWDGTSERVGT